jgi:hypothetical protein
MQDATSPDYLEPSGQMSKKRSTSQPALNGLSQSSVVVDEEEMEQVIPLGETDLYSSRDQFARSPELPVFIELQENQYLPTVWSLEPQLATCRNCQGTKLSVVTRTLRSGSLCCCLVLTIVGMCLAPLCCLCCRDTVHTCGNCGERLGVRSVL